MDQHPHQQPTQHLSVDGGTLAFEVAGATNPVTAAKPLLVLAHGMGDDRRAYRSLIPALVAAGHRVAAVDLRGSGESSARWLSYTRTDIAGDLIALVQHLVPGSTGTTVPGETAGPRAVLVGHSIAGGAVTIAAATAPHLVAAAVELAPFTRKQSISLRDLANGPYRRGATHLMTTAALGSTRAWVKYLDLAHPASATSPEPAGYDVRVREITAMLAEPGRMKALQAMFRSAPTDAGAQLAHVACPVLVIQGGADPDWADPRAEGEAIIADLPAGVGRLEVIAGSGHYPHVQHPTQVADLVLDFLATSGSTTPTGR